MAFQIRSQIEKDIPVIVKNMYPVRGMMACHDQIAAEKKSWWRAIV
jgi:hypothetical protein